MSKKRILLVDRDDLRRDTRILMLEKAGYQVDLRSDHKVAELLDREATFDLVLLALHDTKLQDAVAYSERLRKARPDLPILLLTDTAGLCTPWNALQLDRNRPPIRTDGRDRGDARWQQTHSRVGK